MSLSNCRGKEAKQKIVEKYELKPIMYMKQLGKQDIDGCCGKVVDKYYLFEAKNRITDDIETFKVGYDCGEQFLELIKHPKIPLFNPLRTESRTNRHTQQGEQQVERANIHPLNRELRDAIYLLCAAWGGQAPRDRLRASLDYISSNPDRPTMFFAIRFFNRAVGKDAKKRNFTEILNDLRKDNPTLRKFEFPLMSEVLAAEGVESNL